MPVRRGREGHRPRVGGRRARTPFMTLAGVMALALSVAPDPVLAQSYNPSPGTPLAEAWTAFVEAANAERDVVALEELDRVIRLVEAQHGRQSAEMVYMLKLRAPVLVRLGRTPEAEGAAQDALTMSRALSGPDSPETLDAVHTLALTRLTLGGADQTRRRLFAAAAVESLEAAVAVLAAQPADRAGGLDTMLNTLAAAYAILDRGEASRDLLRRTLDARTQTHGADDPLARSLTLNLGHALGEAERNEEAEALLAPLVEALRTDARVARPALANALSIHAGIMILPERREAARWEAVAIYHQAGCPDAEARRQTAMTTGAVGYPWSGADPACPGDLRLAREIAGGGGLAEVERIWMAQPFAAVRRLSHASDVVVGRTRATYARDADTRASFSTYRYVHREFVASAWAAANSGDGS